MAVEHVIGFNIEQVVDVNLGFETSVPVFPVSWILSFDPNNGRRHWCECEFLVDIGRFRDQYSATFEVTEFALKFVI